MDYFTGRSISEDDHWQCFVPSTGSIGIVFGYCLWLTQDDEAAVELWLGAEARSTALALKAERNEWEEAERLSLYDMIPLLCEKLGLSRRVSMYLRGRILDAWRAAKADHFRTDDRWTKHPDRSTNAERLLSLARMGLPFSLSDVLRALP